MTGVIEWDLRRGKSFGVHKSAVKSSSFQSDDSKPWCPMLTLPPLSACTEQRCSATQKQLGTETGWKSNLPWGWVVGGASLWAPEPHREASWGAQHMGTPQKSHFNGHKTALEPPYAEWQRKEFWEQLGVVSHTAIQPSAECLNPSTAELWAWCLKWTQWGPSVRNALHIGKWQLMHESVPVLIFFLKK